MVRRLPRFAWVGLVALFAVSWFLPTGPRRTHSKVSPSSTEAAPASHAPLELREAEAPGCRDRPLAPPSGAPPRLRCSEARGIVAEVHARFAGPNPEVAPPAFGELLAGWLDPHGLWSAAPDAPMRRALSRHAASLLHELRAERNSTRACASAEALGAELSTWVQELNSVYERAELAALRRPAPTAAAVHLRLSEPVFQDDPVTRPARSLAQRLGQRAADLARAFGSSTRGEELAARARSRYFPALTNEQWSEVVLAAAVRAYVPLLDPHGSWAPFEEEWSLYSEDPGFDLGPRLWGEVTRTAVGVRVLADAVAPLVVGDLVLEVDGVSMAGMPLEQIEQVARLDPPNGRSRRLLALRANERELREVVVDVVGDADPGEPGFLLDAERVRYGSGTVLVIRIPDVPEGLGDSVGRLVSENADAALSGIVLDLRGNGGGSTEAASSVLGLFLPGAPLFPLAARGRLVEIMHAAKPALDQRWRGPVAALVDGYTASAAEMIAGALGAYNRGVVLGRRTFGKGCIQEYADDHVGRGVLRVTTLVYALPDGSAVQRSGLTPHVTLPLSKARDSEADVGGSLPGYTGPDVRDTSLTAAVSWPAHEGTVGPCSDPVICGALRRLGGGGGPIKARAFVGRRGPQRSTALSSGRTTAIRPP